MNEIALLGFFLHVKCWYRMFCVALFFEIHLTSAYFGRNLSFDIFFLISMEPFWIESTVSPEIVCIMYFRIYITLFLKGKNFCIYIANPVLVCIRNIQNINLLNFLHYLNTMLFEDLLYFEDWLYVICIKIWRRIYMIFLIVQFISFYLKIENDFYLHTFFHKMVDLSKDVALLENLKSVTFLRWEI